MASKLGPRIVADNLVLALDCADAKSYAGEPTQNYFINTASTGGWWGDGSNQTIGSKGVVAITDENLKYNGYPTVLWTPGSSRNAYLNGSSDIDTSATSTEWTFSVYAKYEDGSDFSSMNVYLYYPSSDGSAAGTITDVGNGWKRISRTRTGSSNYINLAGITGISSNKKIYLSGWQLEKKQYITPVVGVNSSRSATDGWVDLSGNSNDGTLVNDVATGTSHYRSGDVILPNSARYLDFDGSDDYVNLGTPEILNFSGGTSPTVIAWINTSSSAEGQILRTSESTKYLIFGINSGKLRAQIYDGTNNANDENNNGPTINDGNWHHVAAVFNRGGNIIFYKDGVATTGVSMASVTGETGTPSPYAAIGKRPNSTQYYDGKMANVLIYNKALTAAEILQNYNSTKSRFS